MSRLILRTPRTSQPQGLARVNPALRGLVALFDGFSATDIVNNVRASNITTLATVAQAGRVADFSGSANHQYPHHPSYSQIGPLTILALAEVRTLSNYGALIAKQFDQVTNCPFELRLGSNPTDCFLNLVRANAVGYKVAAGTANTFAAGPQKVAIAVRANTDLIEGGADGFVNGVKSSLSAPAGSGTGAPSDGSLSPVWIGRRSDGVTQLDGKIYYVALVNYAMSDAEILRVQANPMMLYAPLARTIWVPASAGTLISRPNADILTTGWSGTPDAAVLMNNLNEAVANNSSFVTSPPTNAAPGPLIGTLAPPRLAGTHDFAFRMDYFGPGPAQVRVSLLDNTLAVLGASAWQPASAAIADYTCQITIAQTATHLQFEVQ